jgi:tRNA acetyltransferase TAN1
MQDGTPTWVKRTIDGPGVWASCVKGKEKQTVGELCDLFESVRCMRLFLRYLSDHNQLSSELWPIEGRDQTEGHCASEDEDVGDLEAQVAREVAAIKRPRVEKRFGQYLVFLSQLLHILTLLFFCTSYLSDEYALW